MKLSSALGEVDPELPEAALGKLLTEDGADLTWTVPTATVKSKKATARETVARMCVTTTAATLPGSAGMVAMYRVGWLPTIVAGLYTPGRQSLDTFDLPSLARV